VATPAHAQFAGPTPTRFQAGRVSPLVLVSVLCAGILAAGAGGLLSGPAALALAVGGAAAGPTFLLVRLALQIHGTQHKFGPCRGAGFMGMGVLAGGLTAIAAWLVDPAARSFVTFCGQSLAIVMFLLGMMLLPGSADTASARLRRGFDGLSMGVSLSFAGWVLLPPAVGMPRVASLAGMLAIGGLSIISITALRAARYRPAAARCATAAALSTVSLTAMVYLFGRGVPEPAVALVGVPLLFAPLLAWHGARRADPAPVDPATNDPDGTFTGYPVLTVPAGVAALAAGYHLITVGQFDHTAVVLGIGVAAAMATREVLAAVDIRRYARALAAQEAHFRSLVAGANDVTMVVDDDLVVRWQSPAAARQFGLSDQDVLGHHFTDLLHPDDADAVADLLRTVVAEQGAPDGVGRPNLVEARLRDGFGRWRDTESTISDQRRTPEVGALVVHVRDVGERKHLERTLHRLAFTDQLTGLPNRRELMRTIVAQRTVDGHPGALLVIDLHGMTGVNDLRGREVGDAVLIEVARRLRTVAGPDDLPARLAGDEFAVVTVDGPIQAYALGTRLLSELTRPYELPGSTVHLYVSIGLADLAGGDSVDEALGRADLARRRARQLGRNRIEWHDEFLEEQLSRRIDVERELPGAAGRGELDLVFQPIVELHEHRPVGVEALLRWRHPTLGTVYPAELIPIAEELGVIIEIGDWVLGAACRQLAAWRRAGRDVWISVNVSPRQLAAPDFVASVAAALTAYELPADRLTVEIAEAGVGEDLPTVVTQLAGLRALGVQTALDDFGAGQASLAHLRRLPVDILKIDSALFAEPTGRGEPSTPLIDVVVGLGRRLGLEIVAEGLEVEAQLELVRNGGCRYGQGFLLAAPTPAEHVEAYLETYRAPSL
jgi:diguanylate cyclase (GGDEF)-like protein/PAS domain S-box-containing protein